MSMSAALGNFISWSERHRARRDHERLEHERPDEEEASPPRATLSRRNTSEPEAVSSGNVTPPAIDPPEVETAQGDDSEPAVADATVVPPSDGGTVQQLSRRTVTLAELEEERELARRRTSACIFLAVFVLFRLWIEALAEGDVGLILLCLVGTSWTARFIRHNREREEELDRRIAAYFENAEEGSEANRADLRMLSFQAQLALAIMESQRNMLQGGFGHPDGSHGHRGVSQEAKLHWERYQHSATMVASIGTAKHGYGSVTQEDGKASVAANDEALASCSICLSEYDDGDKLVRLPCSHVYHDECVSSWTSNHVRCPLCNFDLESVANDVPNTSSYSLPVDSIV